MTTRVPKGTGRAAHAAKSKKAAQRTPLPGDAPKAASRGPLKKAAKKAVASPTVVPRKPRKAATASGSVDVAWPGASKLQAWIDYAIKYGWASTVEYPNKLDMVGVSVKDGATIKVPYFAGKQRSDKPPTWSRNGREISLRNVGGARGHVDGTRPVKEDVKARITKRTDHTSTDDGDIVSRLDIDLMSMSAEDVLAVLGGKTITWRLSGMPNQTDRLKPAVYCPECMQGRAANDDSKAHKSNDHTRDWTVQNAWKVEDHPVKANYRILHFVSAISGQYRAVSLGSIVEVS
jgi:hypothetical protein